MNRLKTFGVFLLVTIIINTFVRGLIEFNNPEPFWRALTYPLLTYFNIVWVSKFTLETTDNYNRTLAILRVYYSIYTTFWVSLAFLEIFDWEGLESVEYVLSGVATGYGMYKLYTGDIEEDTF